MSEKPYKPRSTPEKERGKFSYRTENLSEELKRGILDERDLTPVYNSEKKQN